MGYEAWQLAAMEEAGYMEPRTDCIRRVAAVLARDPDPNITYDRFCNACYACNVEPSTFTQQDLDELEWVLNQT